MPAPESPRQPDSRFCDWLRRDANRRFIGQVQRDCIPEMTRVFGSSGLYLRPIAEIAPELSGNMMARVTSLYRSGSGFAGQLRCQDGELPLASNSHSLVYALFVLESSPDPLGLLQEIGRILKPEGVALLVCLNVVSPARLRWLWRGVAAHGLHRVEALAELAGLETVRQQALGPFWISETASATVRDYRPSLLDPLRSARLVVLRRREATGTLLRAPATVVKLRPGMDTGLASP